MLKKDIKTALLGTASLSAFAALATYSGLCERKYTFVTEKVKKPLRLALIADLHGCRYGEKQRVLLSRIRRQNPDALVMSGDIFDDRQPIFGTLEFLRGIRGKYPCFFAAGNHEYRSGFERELKDMMRAYGVTVLAGKRAKLTAKNGQSIAICGVDDPEGGVNRFKRELDAAFSRDDGKLYTVLLSHRPELIAKYAKYPCDLVLTGHAHGGQWRIPYILNGLFAPSEGFFPKYAGGSYRRGNMDMVVSRGLARESTPVIPRVFNRPELVIIDIEPVI